MGISREQIEYNLILGTTMIPIYFLFYKGLQYCIQKKVVWRFVILILMFFVLFTFYQKGIYYILSRLSFFSENFRATVTRFYQSKSLGYSVVYVLRELIVIGSLAYFIFYLKQNERLKKITEEQLFAELNYLKAQLHPHFFFNTLNNIYGLALDGSKDTASMVAKLSDMMRYIIYYANQNVVNLEQEISFLKNYIAIERLRHSDNVRIDFDIQGDIANKEIAPLILLPFIENAFKHGLHTTLANAFVEIVLVLNGQELNIQIRNSIGHEKTGQVGGLGLINVKKRLNLVYPDKYEMGIATDDSIFQINLKIIWM